MSLKEVMAARSVVGLKEATATRSVGGFDTGDEIGCLLHFPF